MPGKFPDLSWRGQMGRLSLFMKMSLVISMFTKLELIQIYCSYSRTRNFRMKFCNLSYCFWGQHRCWTETSVGNDFLFINLYCVQLCYCLPQPCTAVPNRRQKGINRALTFVQGCLTFQSLTKSPLIYTVSYFNLGVLEPCFAGLNPKKNPSDDGSEIVMYDLALLFTRNN